MEIACLSLVLLYDDLLICLFWCPDRGVWVGIRHNFLEFWYFLVIFLGWVFGKLLTLVFWSCLRLLRF